jgi:AcrR family transcriptional regulator
MDKRAFIIKVATGLFATKGFEATSVRKIAAESGLSVPGMFHYFSTKEEILYEIMINFMEEVYNNIKEITESDIDPVKKLELLCTYYVQKYTEHQEELVILNSERKSLTPSHQKLFIRKQRDYSKTIEEVVNNLTQKNIVKPINNTVLTFLFYGMVHWTSTWFDRSGEVSPEELGKIVSEVFLHGILKKN